MQTRKDDNAFPVFDSDGLVLKGEEYQWDGLSKREYFAALALQGIIASGNYRKDLAPGVAVEMADELIKALNEQP